MQIGYNTGIEIKTSKPGLYMIGNTHIDPVTRKSLFSVKIGQASNLEKRMRDYTTHNPFSYKIDYLVVEDKKHRNILERLGHELCEAVAEGTPSIKSEFYIVEETMYWEFCDNGFDELFDWIEAGIKTSYYPEGEDILKEIKGYERGM